jgi:hypothetical protein
MAQTVVSLRLNQRQSLIYEKAKEKWPHLKNSEILGKALESLAIQEKLCPGVAQ